MGAYAGTASQPQIMATNNAFKIVLPNMNFAATEAKEPAANSMEAPADSHSREDEILRLLAEHPSITRKEAQALLGVSRLKCNATTTKGNTGRISMPNLVIEAKKQIEKTNRMMDQSVGRTRGNPFESEMRPTIEQTCITYC